MAQGFADDTTFGGTSDSFIRPKLDLNTTADLEDRSSPKRKATAWYKKLPYEHEVLEENLIQFFIEKVIVMREVPLMKAAQLLERENNMKRITEKLQKIGTMTSFASKAANKKMLEAQAMRDKLKTTKPYEGGLGQQQSEVEFTSKEAGKATFKIKQEP